MTNTVAIHKQKKSETANAWDPLTWHRNINRTLQKTSPFFSPLAFWDWDAEDDLFSDLPRRMNRLFSDVFDNRSLRTPWWTGVFGPDVDIVENDKYFKIKAELPGLAADDIDLSIGSNNLTISGEKQEEEQKKDENYLRRECRCGSFSRTIPLPMGTDLDQAVATFDNNVLTIEIPKKEVKTQERKLKISTSSKKNQHEPASHRTAA